MFALKLYKKLFRFYFITFKYKSFYIYQSKKEKGRKRGRERRKNTQKQKLTGTVPTAGRRR